MFCCGGGILKILHYAVRWNVVSVWKACTALGQLSICVDPGVTFRLIRVSNFLRVLLERLIVNRPHPWGLLITFIELIKNPTYKFWNHEFVHCAPEIEK